MLRPGGWLLVSTTHPTADWRHFGGSYFADDWVDLSLAGGQMSIHYQRMTLETFLGELLDAGLRLERLVEPRPVPSLRDVDEAAYHKLCRRRPSSPSGSGDPDDRRWSGALLVAGHRTTPSRVRGRGGAGRAGRA